VGKATVLAASISSLPDLLTQRGRHRSSG
jgi:hypothetical protein